MDLREIGWEVVDWMHLAQDGCQWRTVVITVMNLGLCKRGRGICWLAERLLASQEELCSVELAAVYNNRRLCQYTLHSSGLWHR